MYLTENQKSINYKEKIKERIKDIVKDGSYKYNYDYLFLCNSLLEYIISYGCLKDIKKIIKKFDKYNFDIIEIERSGSSLLFDALLYGKTDIFSYLLYLGIELTNTKTLLNYAIKNNYLTSVAEINEYIKSDSPLYGYFIENLTDMLKYDTDKKYKDNIEKIITNKNIC